MHEYARFLEDCLQEYQWAYRDAINRSDESRCSYYLGCIKTIEMSLETLLEIERINGTPIELKNHQQMIEFSKEENEEQ